MTKRILSVDEIRKSVAPICQRYGVSRAYLFGSYSRNEATEDSDVDILVDRDGSLVHTLFLMGGLYGDLEDAVKKEIDLVTTQTLEQKRTLANSPRFVNALLTERRLLYDRQGSLSA